MAPKTTTTALADELPALLRLWAYPIRDALATVTDTAGKPVGELTMPEVMSWAWVAAYSALTGMIIAQAGANLAAVALRGDRT